MQTDKNNVDQKTTSQEIIYIHSVCLSLSRISFTEEEYVRQRQNSKKKFYNWLSYFTFSEIRRLWSFNVVVFVKNAILSRVIAILFPRGRDRFGQ